MSESRVARVSDAERRTGDKPRSSNLRNQLNQDQQLELATLERFGWELKFIRRPPFQKPIVVVYDFETQRYAVLREDGSLDENPKITIR
jgi:hypothetical protein